ncbi:adenosylcobinamide amidohydrolase [Pontibaca salina]|uniref:Adenosylcobinamide amidohydrolase n=1 Tax=Pontibaca salina TaxID=2795731 RepID=A0A934LXH6_9RHOB|nr:adenosylcobinamide amidohydrolase [Pontibaca salina]MBI6628632.1 adenosylcobinamide amidohydrolase [Pontibaca salina]
MSIRLHRPWLTFDLGTPHRVLSWAVVNPGLVTARHILWREVRNADLPQGFDAVDWLGQEVRTLGDESAVAMLTSRHLDAFETSSATVEDITARCVATVGLSNAERIGTRLDRHGTDWGTINIAVQLSCPLSAPALIEALSIATEARTAAIIDSGHSLPDGLATGTGTDCIAIAAPPGEGAYAGLHTPQGEALGRATYDAVRAGAQVWMETIRQSAGRP